jgi:hypothetical protein
VRTSSVVVCNRISTPFMGTSCRLFTNVVEEKFSEVRLAPVQHGSVSGLVDGGHALNVQGDALYHPLHQQP